MRRSDPQVVRGDEVAAQRARAHSSPTVCEVCGAVFTPKRPWQRCCSGTCRAAASRAREAKAATRIFRTDQGDEAEGLTGRGAADGDHIVIRTNGTTLTVTALEGGAPHTVDACFPACQE